MNKPLPSSNRGMFEPLDAWIRRLVHMSVHQRLVGLDNPDGIRRCLMRRTPVEVHAVYDDGTGPRRLPVRLAPNADGGLDIDARGWWPADLVPVSLVWFDLPVMEPEAKRFEPTVGRGAHSETARRPSVTTPHATVGVRACAEDGPDDDHSPEPDIDIEWDEELLRVTVEWLDTDARKVPVLVEMSVADRVIKRRILRLSRQDDGKWIGRGRLRRPTEACNKEVKLTVRSATAADLGDLRDSWHDGPSEVTRFLASIDFDSLPLRPGSETGRFSTATVPADAKNAWTSFAIAAYRESREDRQNGSRVAGPDRVRRATEPIADTPQEEAPAAPTERIADTPQQEALREFRNLTRQNAPPEDIDQAFTRSVHTCSASLFWTAYWNNGLDANGAEDLLQELWLTAHKKLPLLDDDRNLLGYLSVVLMRMAWKQAEESGRPRTILSTDIDPESNFLETFASVPPMPATSCPPDDGHLRLGHLLGDDDAIADGPPAAADTLADLVHGLHIPPEHFSRLDDVEQRYLDDLRNGKDPTAAQMRKSYGITKNASHFLAMKLKWKLLALDALYVSDSPLVNKDYFDARERRYIELTEFGSKIKVDQLNDEFMLETKERKKIERVALLKLEAAVGLRALDRFQRFFDPSAAARWIFAADKWDGAALVGPRLHATILLLRPSEDPRVAKLEATYLRERYVHLRTKIDVLEALGTCDSKWAELGETPCDRLRLLEDSVERVWNDFETMVPANDRPFWRWTKSVVDRAG